MKDAMGRESAKGENGGISGGAEGRGQGAIRRGLDVVMLETEFTHATGLNQFFVG